MTNKSSSHLLILFIVGFQFFQFASACPGMPIAGLSADSGQTKAPIINQHHGAYLPTEGNIRGMLLFVQTSNDIVQDTDWPIDAIPVWADSLRAELSSYFLEMSHGKLHLQLDQYPTPIKTKDSEEGYLAQRKNYGNAIKDILVDLDKEVTFTDYDNWNSGQPFNVVAGPDGQVDLIIVVFRCITVQKFFPYDAVSDLGFTGYLFVDSAKSFIYGSSGYANDASASGVTLATKYRVTDYNYTLQVLMHELMHKLYGGAHPAELFGGLGVLGHSGGGKALHSLESHMLSYSNYTELTYGADTVLTLHDYVTSREAFLIPLPKPLNYMYAIEFRGKKSRFDTAPSKGIYFYRIYNPWGYSQKNVLVMSADGNYQWGLDTLTNKLFKLYPDALSGFNVYQKIPIGKNYCYADGWWGDPESAFSLQKPLFAPLHNPTPDFIYNGDTIQTNLYCTILAQSDSVALVLIRYRPTDMILQTQDGKIPAGAGLGQNFPNPVFHSKDISTVAPFFLENREAVTLSMFNYLGVRVYAHEAIMEPGNHSVSIPISHLTRGAYIIELRAGQHRFVRQMILCD
jgi:hypothetical protein